MGIVDISDDEENTITDVKAEPVWQRFDAKDLNTTVVISDDDDEWIKHLYLFVLSTFCSLKL